MKKLLVGFSIFQWGFSGVRFDVKVSKEGEEKDSKEDDKVGGRSRITAACE